MYSDYKLSASLSRLSHGSDTMHMNSVSGYVYMWLLY